MGVDRWQSRIVGFSEIAPDQLLANPLNARDHPGIQRDMLRASLDAVGWVSPVLVNQRTGNLVDGHARIEEALTAGLTKVPVITIDVSEEDERLILATFDPIGAMAVTNQTVLDQLLDGIDTRGLDAVIDTITKPVPMLRPENIDEVEEPPVSPVTEPGDIWVLPGKYESRIVCGDSTDPKTYERLLADGLVDALITDPPYGVAYGDTVEFRRRLGQSQRAETDSHVNNDANTDAKQVWAATFPLLAARLSKPSAFYVWSAAGAEQVAMGLALQESGLELHGSIVWVKDRFSFSRAEHKYAHEPCFYGWRAGQTHKWHGPNNETSVWEYPRPRSSEYHPTQKPVELIQRQVRNITGPGGTVLDPFLGSGTTLLAATIEGRACFGIEMEPKYVDIALRRWQELTGIMPERDGQIHDFIG